MGLSIRRGLRLCKDGKTWVVEGRMFDGALKLEAEDGHFTVISESDLIMGCASGEWHTDHIKSDQVFVDHRIQRDISLFPVAAQEAAKRRHYYLTRLMKHGSIISTPVSLNHDIQEIAKELNDPKPPSAISIYRWYKRYGANQDITKLVDHHEAKGRRRKWSSEVEKIVSDVIETKFLHPQNYPRCVVYEESKRHLIELQKRNPDLASTLTLPSRSTIYRYLKTLPQYHVDAARLGKALADRKYRPVLGQQKTEYVLERWEADHTPLDLIVFDEDSLMPHGRPWLTIIIDKHSRMVAGYYLGFGNPSAYSILQALRQAILPKQHVLEQYDEITFTWPVCGKPVVLVCDNGMEFHSDSLIQACMELNIQLQFCPAKTPEYKGSIERFFRTISQGLIHRLPGTTFSNIWKRGDYPSEKLSCISFKALNALICKWIVEVYHQELHRGIGMPPIMKWEKGIKERIIEYPSNLDKLRIITGHVAHRTLFRYGIELNGLKYNSQELQALYRIHGKSLRLLIKFYEDDISYIHVFDPGAKSYMKVLAIDQEYTQSLTLDQHELIRQKLREEARDYMDWNQILQKKHELQMMIDAAVIHKKMAVRKKAAKIRHINSVYPGGIKQHSPSKTIQEVAPLPYIPESDGLPVFPVSAHHLYEGE